MTLLTWKKLAAGNYEAENEKFDFNVEKSGTVWCVHVFNVKINNPDSAHLKSEEFPTLKECKQYAATYQ